VKEGTRFVIDGRRSKDQVAQSGTWHSAATASGTVLPGAGVSSVSDTTTFTVTSTAALDPRPAAMTEWQVGWILQPDINKQVFLPVIDVDAYAGTLTVRGSFAAAGGTGKRWRLYAPPGVTTGRRVGGMQTEGSAAGTLSRWVSADSSRCLFAGYRYESPLAGQYDGYSGTVEHRQAGLSFGGLHYTLHRHYDPVLMRFTSPDPIASPFHNLFAYCGSSPARFFDPDGLEPLSEMAGQWVTRNLDFGWGGVNTGVARWAGGVTTTALGCALFNQDATYWGHNGFRHDDAPSLLKTGQRLGSNAAGRFETCYSRSGDPLLALNYAGLMAFNDLTGATPLIEGLTATDSVTWDTLSPAEAEARLTEGLLNLATGVALHRVATRVAAKGGAAPTRPARGRVVASAPDGVPQDICFDKAELSPRQQRLLAQLPEEGSSVIVRKRHVSLTDIAAMTAKTGDEFAMFTRGPQRMIVRGNPANLPTVSVEFAEAMRAKGWKWSGHTHRGWQPIMASAGDKAVLAGFGQRRLC
jgi:hypothetical protein